MRIHILAILAVLACGGSVTWEPDPLLLARMGPGEKAAADSLSAGEASWLAEAEVLEDKIAQTQTAQEAAASDHRLAEEMAEQSRAALKAGDSKAAKDLELLGAQQSELTARKRYLEAELALLSASRDLCLLRADSCRAGLLFLQAQATGAKAGVQKSLAEKNDSCCRDIQKQLRRVQDLEREKGARHRAWQVLEELWRSERDSRTRRR